MAGIQGFSPARVRRRLVHWAIGLGCVLGAASAAHAVPIGYSVQSDGDDRLYRIDLRDGSSTAVGSTGLDDADIDGLSFQPSTGTLFGVDDVMDRLVTIDTATGQASVVGELGVHVTDTGLAFGSGGTLFLADEGTQQLYSVSGATGAATAIGSLGVDITALAFWNNLLFGINDADDLLFKIDPDTAALTTVGALGEDLGDAGLAFDSIGILWGLGDDEGLFTVDTATGAVTITAAGVDEFESLAIRDEAIAVPEPSTLGLFGLGLFGLMAAARRRRS